LPVAARRAWMRARSRRPAMKRVAICLSALVLLGVSPAEAQDYPARNITVLCPFPAGGGTDILTRILAAELQDKLKATVIVENRPGASTQLAANAAARAAPDGHTLFVATSTTLAYGPSVFKKLPYDVVKDFAPIAQVGSAYFSLVAHPSVGARTLPELIAKVRASDGKMGYATAGPSTPHHLFMEMFLKMIGAKAQHVPYRGSAPALAGVVAGDVQFMMVDLAVAIPTIRAGKVVAYGVTSSVRAAGMPDLPTLAEAGLPGYAASGWFTVVAPAGTPRLIIDRINGILVAAIKRPDIEQRLTTLAIQPLTSTPDEAAALIPAEIKKWAQVIKDAGIEPQ
jgi:tripartite-type tricarboxylate transporter receptor subunit TctC